ncbi:exonuclease domain-containing protein [Schaalia vaccimaxillae]|uniref:exonuclease domain-containing protein n=1 Tax=Schaalia vaccimaxillae TaxID=183916 RepID=UPI0003B3A8F2|nr:exonuclease domain-containing protein [Schaalia vaccimaxillae]
MTWSSDPWMGFDTETTGVDPQEDRLVTAALVLRIGGAQPSRPDQEHTWLADPGVEIPQKASDVHGITTEHARTHGRPVEEVLEELASSLVEHWRRGYPVVAFNAPYDITLVDRELERHGLPTFDQRLGVDPMLVIDPLTLDRALDRFRRGKKTLVDMAPVYGVSASPDAHTAEVDVAMTLDVLAGMAAKFPELAAKTTRELHQYQVEEHAKWARNFADYLRSKGREANIDPSWPIHNR